MLILLIVLLVLLLGAAPAWLAVSTAFGADEPEKRIRESANVLSEIMSTKEKSIPEDLLQKARCVGVVLI